MNELDSQVFVRFVVNALADILATQHRLIEDAPPDSRDEVLRVVVGRLEAALPQQSQPSTASTTEATLRAAFETWRTHKMR